MTRYLQIDLIDSAYLVTGQLLSSGTLDTVTFPTDRRFIDMGDDLTPVQGGSTVVINPDGGEPIVPYGANVIISPPAPPPPPPPGPITQNLDMAQMKLDRILKLLEEP